MLYKGIGALDGWRRGMEWLTVIVERQRVYWFDSGGSGEDVYLG